MKCGFTSLARSEGDAVATKFCAFWIALHQPCTAFGFLAMYLSVAMKVVYPIGPISLPIEATTDPLPSRSINDAVGSKKVPKSPLPAIHAESRLPEPTLVM